MAMVMITAMATVMGMDMEMSMIMIMIMNTNTIMIITTSIKFLLLHLKLLTLSKMLKKRVMNYMNLSCQSNTSHLSPQALIITSMLQVPTFMFWVIF